MTENSEVSPSPSPPPTPEEEIKSHCTSEHPTLGDVQCQGGDFGTIAKLLDERKAEIIGRYVRLWREMKYRNDQKWLDLVACARSELALLDEREEKVSEESGIVIAKIADLVHNHAYQWQHVDFIQAARSLRMNPCDVAIKVDPASANLSSSKWKRVLHLRRAHLYWIVVRTDGSCETCGGSHV